MEETSSIPTEADLEAKLSAVIQAVFPTLDSTSITHQKSFSLRLGHSQVSVKGTEQSLLKGRCDVLIYLAGKPIALLELKRSDLSLTDNDKLQAISYARLTDPWPPLTILSNGESTKIFETYSGEVWKPETFDEKAIEGLIEKSGELAASDLRNAVDALLGKRPG